jgi:hypothetical protein
MTETYIVLAEYVNLNGIKENKEETYQTYKTGDGNTRRHLIPSYMHTRGQKFDIDLSTLSSFKLDILCEKEASFALVRVNTKYED